MGCSASVTPTSTIPSIKKIDVGTNTVSDASLPISLPIGNANKHSNDISTQTDSAQDDWSRDQTLYSKNLQNTDSNLTDSRSNRVSDNQNDFRQRANSNELDIKTYNQINPRFYQDPLDHEELDWILTGMDANQFCINHQSLLASSTQVTPAMVVDAMEKSDDLAHIAPKVRKLLNKAKSTGDATYLVQAYTVESKFYKILNRNLARQSLGNPTDMNPIEQMNAMLANAFGQLDQCISNLQGIQASGQITLQNTNETDWTKLFLQAIYRLIMTPNSTLRYQGPTYRGMRLTQKELEYYSKDRTFICNKAITSTSKLRSVAQSFIDSSSRPEDTVDVMFTYNIDSYSALLAIDVHTISSIPDEEEVLIMPGILFTIRETKIISAHSREIELRSAYKELSEGMMADSFAALFTEF